MKSTAPFPSPPGLEPDFAAATAAAATLGTQEAKSMTLGIVEEKLSELGPDATHEEIVQVVREAVLAEVEQKVQEKTTELWAKGKQVLGQMQQRHKEKTTELMAEVQRCQEKQKALTAENERLKQVLQGLAARFTMLGAAFGQKDHSLGALSPEMGAQSTIAGLSPLHMEDTPSQAYTPGPFTPSPYSPAPAADAHAGSAEVKLPDVPAFPFPTSTPGGSSSVTGAASPAPLSLSEALGATATPTTQQRKPLSLANSLGESPAPPQLASPFTQGGRGLGHPSASGLVGGSGLFSFTLRKADGAELGLNVSHHEDDKVLRVEGVRPDGAVEAWNRQCHGSPFAEKAVLSGDRIICVNSVYYDPVKMLEECKDKQLLKLTIVRGNFPLPPAPVPSQAADTKKTVAAALNANASVFVPRSPEPTSSAQTEASSSSTPTTAVPKAATPPTSNVASPKASGNQRP
eukprot:TRINITY_DN79378_c0_g1_i1.p1 TRINITY_DN79378_c0_g1~~TRINITY_DN79378_c0_g1_i1.p1  ORF type:complete len:460 (+),score=133.26 TRINITY_DN79378_c0_g1_i1:68-1447(+)